MQKYTEVVLEKVFCHCACWHISPFLYINDVYWQHIFLLTLSWFETFRCCRQLMLSSASSSSTVSSFINHCHIIISYSVNFIICQPFIMTIKLTFLHKENLSKNGRDLLFSLATSLSILSPYSYLFNGFVIQLNFPWSHKWNRQYLIWNR